MRRKCDGNPNETDESEWQNEKHDDSRIST
jgi:hypothetical protein